jgi:hypothetical protein
MRSLACDRQRNWKNVALCALTTAGSPASSCVPIFPLRSKNGIATGEIQETLNEIVDGAKTGGIKMIAVASEGDTSCQNKHTAFAQWRLHICESGKRARSLTGVNHHRVSISDILHLTNPFKLRLLKYQLTEA